MKAKATKAGVTKAVVAAAAGLAWGLAAAGASAKTADPIVRCRVELDQGVLAAGRTQTAVVKVTLDADRPLRVTERPAVNLAVVLDRSGSMNGDKLEKAKEAAIEALRRLDHRDLFSLVIYDHTVETVVPAQSAANSEWIEARIRQIRSGGNTALFAGVSQGAAEVRKNVEGRYVHRIILLSDGLANVGPSSPEDLGRLGAGLVKEGISVTTVGVGSDYNEDLMARLSQNSDGNTYFVRASADLPRIFGAELGDVLSVVANRVNLIIECPEGIKPISIIGREGRIRDRTIELSLNQLYGGQQKFALVEVEVPAGKAGERRPVASARVDYVNALTLREEADEARAETRYTDAPEEAELSINVAVRKASELNRNAEAQEQAIQLADDGRVKEAATALRQSAEKLRSVGKKLNEKELLKKAEAIEQQAAAIEKDEDLSPEARKQLRAESYQTKNQQLNQ